MRIKVFYRNYRSLHPLFKSLKTDPPKGIDYFFPQVIDGLFTKIGFKIYRKTGDIALLNKVINYFQDIIFTKSSDDNNFDLYEYIQIVPKENPTKPYVVDLEHCGGLFNFRIPTTEQAERVYKFLSDKNCKSIVCTSKAAEGTFTQYFTPKQISTFQDKIRVIYPALESNITTPQLINKDDKIELLFVGREIYRKGLHEVIEAMRRLDTNKFSLKAVIGINEEFVSRNRLPNVEYFEWGFSHDQMLNDFFKPSDLFLMPTHVDTFGMVFLDALSNGVPVITTSQFATPEIVVDHKNGRFVESDRLYLNEKHDGINPNNYIGDFPKDPEEKLVKSIVNVLEKLNNDRDLIEKMKIEALKDFQDNGKFSVYNRNRSLLNLYEEALISE